MKALKAYNTEGITRFHQRKVHNTEIVDTPQDEPPWPPVPENDLPDLPESDLDIPNDPILDFVNSQCHNSDRIPSTTPGAEPPRDAKDSGSARSHSTHLETSSSDRP